MSLWLAKVSPAEGCCTNSALGPAGQISRQDACLTKPSLPGQRRAMGVGVVGAFLFLFSTFIWFLISKGIFANTLALFSSLCTLLMKTGENIFELAVPQISRSILRRFGWRIELNISSVWRGLRQPNSED